MAFTKDGAVDIYRFTNYRAYLKAHYEECKAKKTGFSYHAFALKAGISSGGFILHVIKAERNLTQPVMLKLAKAMKLNRTQIQYFENLVGFDQAKSPEEKQYYYSKLLEQRPRVHEKTMHQAQYEFYAEWYHSALRELLGLRSGVSKPADLGKQLVPPVSAARIKESLELLRSLGIVKATEGEGHRVTDAFLSAGGPGNRAPELMGFQKQMNRLADKAWDRFPPQEISMHTLMCTVSAETFSHIVEEVRELKKRVLMMAQEDSGDDRRVVNMNIQLFPLSKRVVERKD